MSGKPWSKDEIALLEWMARENKSPRKHQSKFPNRNYQSILVKMARMGLSTRKWSTEDTEILIQKVKEDLKAKEIKNFLPFRTVSSIQNKMNDLGITQERTWTAREKKILKDGREEGMHYKEFLPFLNRTIHAISQRCLKLGVGLGKKIKYWTNCEIETLVELHGKGLTYSQIGNELNKNIICINNKIKRLGFAQKEKINPWSKQEEELLTKLYKSKVPYEEISKQLQGRSVSSLSWKTSSLGIKPEKEIFPKGKRRCSACLLMFDDNQKIFPIPNSNICRECKNKRYQVYVSKVKQKIKDSFFEMLRNTEIIEKELSLKEFPKEPDLENHIAHILIRKYKLDIELQPIIPSIGVPDIYIPQLNLLLEIKLSEKMWKKKSIIEQVVRYNQIEECWLICLDEKPEWAKEKGITWYTPSQLFHILDGYLTNPRQE